MRIDRDDELDIEEFCRGRNVRPEEIVHVLVSEYLGELEDRYPEEIDTEGIKADLRYERLCDERLGI